MRKTWVIGGLGLLLVAGVVAGVVVTRGDRQHDKDKKPELPLEFSAREIVSPTLASLPLTLQFSGPLVAPSSAVVRAKAAGTLLALEVGEGSRVRAGQTIGRIDLSELDARVAERNALVESARAQLAQAERTHASNQRLADQQFISPIALDSSRAALETAQAQLRAAEAALQTTRAGAREAALVAPIAGVVHKRHVLPGEKLSVEQSVVTLVDLTRLELAASVGTHEIAQLAPGMPVQVRVEGFESEVEGRLARIAPAAEAGTRSIGVTVALDNPQERFRAGQYAIGRVVLDDPARRLTLPLSAVGGSAGQEQVWVIEDGALLRRSVTTGRRDEREGRVEIVSGLDARARVLGARFDNLREGHKALIVAPSAAPAPVASASASSSTTLK